MADTWNIWLKELAKRAPQEFVNWLFPGAVVERIESEELLKKRKRRNVDLLARVIKDGEPQLRHIEFQSTGHPRMGERLLEYNLMAEEEFGLPVQSCVIYLRDDSSISLPPLIKALPDGRIIYWFDYDAIELAKTPSEVLLNLNQTHLLALVPFTREGQQRRNLEPMIDRLHEKKQFDTLSLGLLMATEMVTESSERAWLRRMVEMLQSDLRGNWFYQSILQEGFEEGKEKGIAEGESKGEAKASRQLLISIVETRFPELLSLARKKGAECEDIAALQRCVVSLSIAPKIEVARAVLQELPTQTAH
jgi:predicted transposase YdaD